MGELGMQLSTFYGIYLFSYKNCNILYFTVNKRWPTVCTRTGNVKLQNNKCPR